MKNGRKIMALAVVISLCLSDSVYAANELPESTEDEMLEMTDVWMESMDYDVELERAKEGISDIPITEEMLDSCKATITNEDGTMEDADVYVTVRELGRIEKSGQDGGTVYCTTAFASSEKTDSGTSETVDHTYAYGSILWIDNLGVKNRLLRVTGGWSTSDDVITGREVGYGISGKTADPLYVTQYPSGNTFTYNGNSRMEALWLCLETWVSVNGRKLRLRVTNHVTT